MFYIREGGGLHRAGRVRTQGRDLHLCKFTKLSGPSERPVCKELGEGGERGAVHWFTQPAMGIYSGKFYLLDFIPIEFHKRDM